MIKLVLATAVLALGAPAGVAFAQDYPGELHERLERLRDHVAHDEAHHEIGQAHEEAHEQGFSSGREHEAYHQGLNNLHEGVHDELPGTWHSQYNGGGYAYGRQAYYGAPAYYGAGSYYSQPRYVTRYVTRRYRRPVHHREYTYYRSY